VVRGDGKLNRSIRDARSWRNSSFDAEVKAAASNELAFSIGMSFSGKERNRLFLSRKAEQFVNLSAVSGLDSAADGRVLVLWDFDRDGWQDMAVANANAPLLNIYRNEIGEANGSASSTGRMVAIRFVGGSRTAEANKQFGSRDGYGAKVLVTAGELNLIREYRCGEGMAGQNSSTMIIGIGENDVAHSVAIRWPSGIQQQVDNVPAGTLLTIYEDPQQSPEKLVATRESYVVPLNINWHRNEPTTSTVTPKVFRYGSSQDTHSTSTVGPQLQLYTTMATWCEACKSHLPQIQQLRSKLDSKSIGMYGIPIDESDDTNKLSKYVERYKPAYELLQELTDDQRKEIGQLISDTLKVDALPATVVTDSQGNVLLVTAGLPTVSQLNKILQSQ
jgi:thiol-disulfide isomerase/thioredoxin